MRFVCGSLRICDGSKIVQCHTGTIFTSSLARVQSCATTPQIQRIPELSTELSYCLPLEANNHSQYYGVYICLMASAPITALSSLSLMFAHEFVERIRHPRHRIIAGEDQLILSLAEIGHDDLIDVDDEVQVRCMHAPHGNFLFLARLNGSNDKDSRLWHITQAQMQEQNHARRARRVAAFSDPTASHCPGKPKISV